MRLPLLLVWVSWLLVLPANAGDNASDVRATQLLNFSEVKLGSVVLDLVPHKLAFSHNLADKVGSDGHVYIFVPSEADAYLKAKYPNGLPTGDPDQPDISYVHASLAKVVAPQYLDVVWVGGSYHDFHNKFFALKDIGEVNRAVFGLLKPGGLFVVMDNAAAAGSGLRDTDSLHRIDEKQVMREILAAGFKSVGESRVLRNASDNHTSQVSDADVGAKTDVFLLKFRKPD
jgi:predicted methyltransferase